MTNLLDTTEVRPTSNRPAVRPADEDLRLVAVDLYRDIHKAIRAELFALTHDAGRIDPADRVARAAVASHVDDVVALLRDHADHEDGAIQPVLWDQLPTLAGIVEADHGALEDRMDTLVEMAGGLVVATEGEQVGRTHRLYLELASFTGEYLRHQDVEERVIMPAIEAAVGPQRCGELHGAIVGSIPPEELMRSLALMLPAMNVNDRVELLGGMRANGSAEVVEAVLTLAAGVLDPVDHAMLLRRLDG